MEGWEGLWDDAWDIFRSNAKPHNLAVYLQDKIPYQSQILDLGCGMGRNLFYLANLGCRVIGLDMSWTALLTVNQFKLKQNLPIELLQGDFKSIPFKNKSFNVVLSVNTLYHSPKGQFSTILEKIMALLKNDGLAVFNILSSKTWLFEKYLDLVEQNKACEIEPGCFQAYPEYAEFDLFLPHSFFELEELNNLINQYNVEGVFEEWGESKGGKSMRWSVILRNRG